MKFLLEFVSCCGGGGWSQKDVLESSGELQSEETRALMRVTTRRIRSRKRGRVGTTTASAAADWKPTLCPISENNVVVLAESPGEERRERAVKRKGGGGGVRDINSSYNHEDSRRTNHITIIPAFSATPFMI